jgi:cytoskeletal protein CcmA (bactofilin family)
MPSPSSRSVLSVLLVVLLALAVLPGTAAAETRSGGSVVVGANETVDDDLDVFAGSIVVRGTVTGDLNAFGGSVRVVGTVEGNVSATAGTVTVARNGTVGGSLDAAAETVTVDGRVDGDVSAGAQTLRLGPSASVGGDVTYSGELDRADGATVAGTVSQGDVDGGADAAPVLPGLLFGVYFLLVNAVLGVVLLAAFPAFSRAVADRGIDAPLKSGGVGLAALVGIPVVLIALVITIVGIPFTLLGVPIFLAFAWIGAIYGRYAIGTWLVDRLGRASRWLAFFSGLLVVFVLTLLPVVGGLVELLVIVYGVGALTLSLVERYRRAGRADPAESVDATEPL